MDTWQRKGERKTYRTSESTQLVYSIFVSEIFGMNTPISSAPSDLKNHCQRIIKTLRRTIELNLTTDKQHYKQIQGSLEKLEISFKDDDFEPLYMIGLFKLIFLILGDLPNNWRKKSTSNDNSYLLNRRRSFFYNQTTRQKINVIAEAHRDKKEFENKIKWWELSSKFRKEHPGVKQSAYSQEFLTWYSNQYPLLYSQLF